MYSNSKPNMVEIGSELFKVPYIEYKVHIAYD